MKSIDFIIDSVNFLLYKCHKINLKRGGSNKDSSDSMKNKKKRTISPINDALKHAEIGKILQRISKVHHFVNKYN